MELLKCVRDSCTHSHKLDEDFDALVGVVALDAIKVREEAIKKKFKSFHDVLHKLKKI